MTPADQSHAFAVRSFKLRAQISNLITDLVVFLPFLFIQLQAIVNDSEARQNSLSDRICIVEFENYWSKLFSQNRVIEGGDCLTLGREILIVGFVVFAFRRCGKAKRVGAFKFKYLAHFRRTCAMAFIHNQQAIADVL